METKKKIYFVRHGETDANLNEYVPGKLESLNDTGFHQAFAFTERIKNLEFDKLMVSEYLRSQQTAAPLAEVSGKIPEVHTCFGEMFEPTSIHGISDHDERVIEHRYNRNAHVEDPVWRQEDGENFTDLFARVAQARSVLESDLSESILIVSHSFFIQLFTAAILLDVKTPTNDWFQVGKTLKLSNTGITLFTVSESEWRLVMWNDHAHFAE